jgi:hypothetical protein
MCYAAGYIDGIKEYKNKRKKDTINYNIQPGSYPVK